MADKEELEIVKRLLPLVGVSTAAIVALTVLIRVFAFDRRVQQNGRYLVSVRHGQWHDLREFITPDDPAVLEVCAQAGPDVWQLFDFVCKQVSYKQEVGDMWQFPPETLARGEGDCEDTSLLLCSMLRNFTDAHVVLGSFEGYGHAWCQLDGQVLETTFTSARAVHNPEAYELMVMFNESEVIELWPGALDKVFSLRRNEATKLSLIAQALECTLR